MRIVLLGPPGCGKGTQAARICERFAVPHIATGDLFRQHAASGDALGRKAKAYMDRGDLVPDEIVLEMVRERLTENDCASGFILDGFPRTVNQADELEAMLMKNGMKLETIIEIQVPDEEIVRRLSGRRVCAKCGEIFHLQTRPPKIDNRCDRCCHPLEHRMDDRPDAIRNRVTAYHKQTEPLIHYYQKRGLIRSVNGAQSPEWVFEAIMRALAQ